MISVVDAKQQLKKVSNWKGPGPDGVQGFWLKNFKALKTVWAGMFNTVLSHFWSVRAGNIIETTDCIQPRENKRIEEEEQERIYREKKM